MTIQDTIKLLATNVMGDIQPKREDRYAIEYEDISTDNITSAVRFAINPYDNGQIVIQVTPNTLNPYFESFVLKVGFQDFTPLINLDKGDFPQIYVFNNSLGAFQEDMEDITTNDINKITDILKYNISKILNRT